MLRTVGDAALYLDATVNQVVGAIRKHAVPHAQLAGGSRLFSEDQVEQIRQAIATMPRRGRRKLAEAVSSDTQEGVR